MPDSTGTLRLLSADFLTLSYRVVGKLNVSTSGVIGLLNDSNKSFMEVHDAKCARIHMPTKLVGEYPVMDLVKTNLFAVCFARREDMGPQALVRGGYQKFINYNVRVTTQVYELEGTLEWGGRFEFAAIMVEGSRDFVPLYNARLTSVMFPQLSIESPAILFNRRQVDFLTVISDKKPTGPIA
jgi:hypothetical protein